MKLLSDGDLAKLKQTTELEYMRDQGRNMHLIDDELYFTIEEKNHQIDLTEKGREFLAGGQDKDMFILPDIATELSQMDNQGLSPEEKQLKRDQLNILYAERSDRLHTISQLLRAYTLYEKDVEYVVEDGKVKIVDELPAVSSRTRATQKACIRRSRRKRMSWSNVIRRHLRQSHCRITSASTISLAV